MRSGFEADIDKVNKGTPASLEQRRHLPVATYRLQLNRFFTFDDARKVAAYLQRLGISDVYASPYLKARPDSLHGYDIIDHNELNPTIGDRRDYDVMVAELHRHGLRQILDIVPNHMGIGEENRWWTDVLENGRASIYAQYFDIDWEPLNTKLAQKVLLPLLGDQYGKVLENGELAVAFLPDEGRFVLRYYEHTLPIDPASYDDILCINRDSLIEELGAESETANEYQSILTAVGHLPRHWEQSADKSVERNREKEVIKRRLTALCAAEPRVGESIERGLHVINGTGEDYSPRPHGRYDRLDSLLERQPYRLSFWRVATEEINYRRFFDVNELAAIRVDRPAVFEETHRLILSLLREGKVDGLRVDHVDGLRDPAAYLQALQRAYTSQTTDDDRPTTDEALSADGRSEPSVAAGRPPLYVVVEKILAQGEPLPSTWPVYGTTGYEYTNLVNGLFVDSANARAFDDIYEAFTGEEIKYADLVYRSKQQIMRVALASEIMVLTNMLNHISAGDRRYRDFTTNGLRSGIRELIASFPVYRTYLTPDITEPGPHDREIIETALSRARRRNPAMDPTVFDFLRDILLLRWDVPKGNPDRLSAEAREARWDFIMKFQQVTSPVTAKGIEDTAFYIYARLISLNEVGGEPDHFGTDPAAFHRAQADRLRDWPYSLLATSTHDTKRSEDARARINVISEIPGEWRTVVRRFSRSNRKFKRRVEGALVPSADEEYFLYQTLLGIWPFADETSGEGHEQVVGRVQEYMRKALNEAKVHTSWINTNEAYLSATSDFISAILRRDEGNRFLSDFSAFHRRIARYGAFNSLSQLLLKLTSPGVPDIYQGNEIWDFSLVDPDNRRPVDYDLRRRLLASVSRIRSAEGAGKLLDTLEDGRVKMFVTSRALAFRQDNRELFSQGSYVPLQATGKEAGSVIAFARSYEGTSALTVVPRFLTKLHMPADGTGAPIGEVWGDSRLDLPPEVSLKPGHHLRNIFTGQQVQVQGEAKALWLSLRDVFALFPVALLTTDAYD